MNVPKIEQLDKLIKQHIGKNKTIVDTKITRLTAPGENYGSEMLKVDLIVKSNDTGSTEDFNVVAKLIPSSEFFRVVFNIQVSFKNEKAFYDTIVPTLQDFQKKHGIEAVIDFFPSFFGSRNNLKYDDGQVDDDAALVLENLKIKGYTNIDRQVGFDIPSTKLILKYLAQLHAVTLALKQEDPKLFESKVKPYLAHFSPNIPNEASEKIISFIEESEKCRHLAPKLRKSFDTSDEDESREILNKRFHTLVHKDLWVNNIMLKLNNGSPIDCKFVDFQGYSYASPATDVLFFLFTSVELEALQNNLDDLLKFYLEQFNSTLKSLNSHLSLTYDGLINEICGSTQRELSHVVFMTLVVILTPPMGGPPPSIDGMNGPPDLSKLVFKESAVEKILWVLEEWDKRGWMKFEIARK